MSDERSQSETTIMGAVPILGAGSMFVAISNIFDGTVSTIIVICGVVMILCGAVLLGKGLQQKKAEGGA